jgi:leucyl aminopeptidase
MKFHISKIPADDFASDLLIYVYGEEKTSKKQFKPGINLPASLTNLLHQSFALDNFGDEKSKINLFHFPESQIPRLLICKIDTIEGNIVDEVRKNAGHIYSRLKGLNIRNCHIVSQVSDISEQNFVEALMEGFLLKNYNYSDLKKSPDKSGKVKIGNIVFLLSDKTDNAGVKKKIKTTEAVIEGVNFARHLGDTPGNILTPIRFGREIQKRFKDNKTISLKILNESDIKKLKMNAFLAVAGGSKEPPRLIILQYQSNNKKAKNLLLVGKGITFDSGGISIKPSAQMEEMKYDMCGAAAVAGVLDVAGKIKPDVNITGIIPAAENLPDASAFKPGDVVKAYNSKTIEIINTDAEGRLLLADALAYGIRKYHPDCVVDLATLTGSVVAALGSHASGLFSNHSQLSDLLINAGKQSGERVWKLPLWDDYKEDLESEIADIKNLGGREAGSISAAKFLQEFVGDVPWAHLDIAGTAYGQKHVPYLGKGASGVGVRLLVELLSVLEEQSNC